jgi:hypothetical protein
MVVDAVAGPLVKFAFERCAWHSRMQGSGAPPITLTATHDPRLAPPGRLLMADVTVAT